VSVWKNDDPEVRQQIVVSELNDGTWIAECERRPGCFHGGKTWQDALIGLASARGVWDETFGPSAKPWCDWCDAGEHEACEQLPNAAGTTCACVHAKPRPES
jgi:hypothetical protein